MKSDWYRKKIAFSAFADASYFELEDVCFLEKLVKKAKSSWKISSRP